MYTRSPAPSPPPCFSSSPVLHILPVSQPCKLLDCELQSATGCDYPFELEFKLDVASLLDKASQLKSEIRERTRQQREKIEQTRDYILNRGSGPPPPFVEMVLREKREKEAALAKITVVREKGRASTGSVGIKKKRSKKGGRSKKV